MNLKHIRDAVVLNRRLEEAEARKVTCAWRLTELMNRRCRNEAARLRFIDRTQSDLADIIREIEGLKAQMKAVMG